MESSEMEVIRDAGAKKRDLFSFWILGLCNNFGYVVMLTAATDIINTDKEEKGNTGRWCTPMSTGAILLADIIPSFVIKTLSPFLPYNAKFRVIVSCFTTIASFLSVAFASSKIQVILGVALTSFSSGLGEPTFLAHSTHYSKNVVSAWSSGTGGAGIVGALSYSLMREIGLSNRQTLLLMLLVPVLELFIFFLLLNKPSEPQNVNVDSENEPLVRRSFNESHSDDSQLTTLAQKFSYIPQLMVYFIPLSLVYFFEYFINQGLFELIIFNNSISYAQQYRWYQVTYQIGVFVSRSSVNLMHIRKTYIMAIIQGCLGLIFLTEAIYLFVPSISIIFLLIFIEGMQGGLAYVNTYYKISHEVPSSHKEFAMNIVASSDSIGIILAGFLAIPTHNWICQMPSIVNI